jgi:hypothetical protein
MTESTNMHAVQGKSYLIVWKQVFRMTGHYIFNWYIRGIITSGDDFIQDISFGKHTYQLFVFSNKHTTKPIILHNLYYVRYRCIKLDTYGY